ncbi:MAG: beta-1,6-N-acetylglucosaminyltransferase [Segetibacter sp.]
METELNSTIHWDKSIIPYFGSQWWAITPDCAKYILDFLKENPKYYIQSKFTFAPDEHFFHTIIGNSSYKEKSDGAHKYIGMGTWRMANFHLIAPSLTKWYSINDWNKISSSGNLFVRKLNSTVSKDLIQLIDEKILKS